MSDREHPGKEPAAMVHWVHRVLLWGLVASSTFLLIGLVLALAFHESRPEGPPARLSALFAEMFRGDGVAALQIGLVILMLTPVARVVVLAIGWQQSGDRRFAAVAVLVFVLLMTSVWWGAG